MKYKELATLFHMDTSSSRDAHLMEEYQKRFTAESTFRLGYTTEQGELFIAVPRELSVLTEAVYKSEAEIAAFLKTLPKVASSAMLRSMVLDEIVYTNQIEDIRSTRKEAKEALIASQENCSQSKRFQELATLYLDIVFNSARVPHSPRDIRALFNKVTAGEIAEDKLPDGKLFRKDGVEIINSGSKVVHRGLAPESNITEAIKYMLSLLQDNTIPKLYRVIASHYLFEYAHPFYDGNGRTGRYLLSLLLNETLSAPTALSLSKMLSENRTRYYKAFRSVENPLNHAELTLFVYTMLDVLHSAQLQILERFESCEEALASIEDTTQVIAHDFNLKPKETQIVSMMIQYDIFGLLDDVSVSEIARCLNIGKQMARKYALQLEQKGIIEKMTKRDPLTFVLTQSFRQCYHL